MKERSRVEQFEGIRRDRREGLSIRQLAVKYRVHRRTVRAALVDAVPPPRKAAEREAVAFGPYEPVVRSWLIADLDAPRKQRHTARRVWQRLLEEHDAQVAESTIRPHVARLKVEVGLAARRGSSLRLNRRRPRQRSLRAVRGVDRGGGAAAVDVRAAVVALWPRRAHRRTPTRRRIVLAGPSRRSERRVGQPGIGDHDL